MRVAYLVNYYPMVSLSFIRREIRGLEARGIEVHRFAIRPWPGTLVDDADLAEQRKTRYLLSAGAVRLIWSVLSTLVARPRRFWQAAAMTLRMAQRSDRSLVRHLAYLAEATLLRQWTAQAGIDHVHAHFSANPTDVALLCHLLGGPSYSFMVHGPEEFDRAQCLSLEEKVTRAAFVTAISNYCRSQLYRWVPASQWSKIHIVRCALDNDFLDAAPDSIDPESKRLVCVGRLCEQKGHLLLIEAAARLAAKKVDFELVLVGDGELRSVIEQRIVDCQLGNKARILGWATSEEVRNELRQSRALVLPSFAEGLPVVIMEALALQRPVISTYIAGIPELIVPGKNGWLVPAGAVEPLAAAMEHALASGPGSLDAMGQDGAARVRSNHNVSVESKKLSALLDQVHGQAI